jgi:hypothetical protein
MKFRRRKHESHKPMGLHGEASQAHILRYSVWSPNLELLVHHLHCLHNPHHMQPVTYVTYTADMCHLLQRARRCIMGL